MIWRFFEERTNLFEAPVKRMLHVAPEPELSRRFRESPFVDYLSIDIDMPAAMMHMDVTDLSLDDESFDVVYCSHVLEHIPDDRKAIAELFRVLKPGGWAILQVPVLREATEEDPTAVTPEERLRRFGQADHVRAYGPDYRDRLAQGGFDVTVDDFAQQLDSRYAVDRTEQVYYCTKPGSASRKAQPSPRRTGRSKRG
jgi:SAM-dependent methyltransferase